MTKIVVNGSFDVVHYGHLKLLEYARSFPNSYVLVLIDSDLRIQQLKGPSRPVNKVHERKFQLSSLKYVDDVAVFGSDEELIALIKDFSPDYMIKGSDYKDKPVIGSEYCKEIIFYDRIKNYSTTQKIQSIINR
jgi:D-beta-D-heptose 7-phosphate kinase/D-beta-D-heptose 1-phosphate adenosyltransferase